MILTTSGQYRLATNALTVSENSTDLFDTRSSMVFRAMRICSRVEIFLSGLLFRSLFIQAFLDGER